MSTGVIILIVVLAILAIAAVAVVAMYNRFVSQRNLVAESWRQIDVELKRRYDLIPNLIETVKAFASHERQVFESVVQARANAVQVHDTPGRTPEAQAHAEKQLSGSLGRLFALAENYPTLQSNQNFLNLQHEMTDTEDRIAAGRRFYNGNVRALNTRVDSFPSNIIANIFGFKKEQYFELDDIGARDAVRADFSTLTGSGPSDRDVYRQPGPEGAFVPGRATAQPELPQSQPQVRQQWETPQSDPQQAGGQWGAGQPDGSQLGGPQQGPPPTQPPTR
ncbi:LemA family protein [Blastococcus sp. Marseille-P5729]|uniref:LemA family protein n=1 Tax=Blastococcus sp. Marseille-P5729 TaxID=2086582 RepID=UPI000D0F88CB|nr:LemA family protein [Blastococcus sp. Marseille-P5729]